MFRSPGWASAFKRCLDIAVSAVGLVLVAPLLGIAAVAIRLESPGPSFFRQQRVGRGFRPITIYKLRTMRMHADAVGPLVTAADDQRVTRLGRFLRRSKLDELPQLWNVLRGDMSLVGPRPEVPHYVEMFRRQYEEVLTVRPGVTDLASLTFRDEEQILAAASDPEAHYVQHVLPAKIALATEYVRRASPGFDLEIILKTALEGVSARLLPARSWFLRNTRPFVVLFHLLLIVASSYLAFWLRFDGAIPADERMLWARTLIWLLLIRVPALALFRLFEGLWRYTSIHDLQNILAAVIGSEIIFYVTIRIWMGELSYPRSVFLIDAMLLVFLMGSARLGKRFYEESGQLRASRRALVVGDWSRSDFVIRAMKSQVLGNYRPIGIVSTTPGAPGRRIHGVPVLGHIDNLVALVDASVADEIVLAYDRSLTELDKRIMSALSGFALPVRDAFQLMVTVVDTQVPQSPEEPAAATGSETETTRRVAPALRP